MGEQKMAEKKAGFRDEKKPKFLEVTVKDDNGREWGKFMAMPKDFSTGSVGYYAGEKIKNPENPEARYQVGLNLTLIGSKPE
jgi:hypothetical protein